MLLSDLEPQTQKCGCYDTQFCVHGRGPSLSLTLQKQSLGTRAMGLAGSGWQLQCDSLATPQREQCFAKPELHSWEISLAGGCLLLYFSEKGG